MIQRACTSLGAAIAMLAATAGPALACPVCFGQSNEPMAIATNRGIIAMLVVVVGVLGAFASFFIYLIRRANVIAGSSGSVEAGRYADGGTA
jgi:hypothetical protein